MVSGLQESDIRDLLISTSSRLTSLNDFLKLHSAELAPYFNVFDFITPNENRLSDIIAYFLDPKEGHGQGDVFLKIFLENIGLQGKFTNLKDVSVHREQSTEEYRRIDIVIEQKDIFGIGIENKPWAEDQDRQLSDYVDYLLGKEYEKSFCLIYLAPAGSKPSKESIDTTRSEQLIEEKKLKNISFPQFRKWVSEWRNACQSDRVRGFLKDLDSYLHHEFEGGSNMLLEENTVVAQAVSTEKNLEAALHIANNVNGIKEWLLGKLKGDIEKKLNDEKSELKLDWKLNQWETNSYFSFQEQTWKSYYICFSPESTQLNNFYFGICKIEEDRNDISDIEKYLGPGNKDNWCPWFQYFEEPYLNWNSNIEPWVDILVLDDKNSKMVKKIFEKVSLLHKRLTECAHKEQIEL